MAPRAAALLAVVGVAALLAVARAGVPGDECGTHVDCGTGACWEELEGSTAECGPAESRVSVCDSPDGLVDNMLSFDYDGKLYLVSPDAPGDGSDADTIDIEGETFYLYEGAARRGVQSSDECDGIIF
mmetsp:Transcript_14216/g.49434  ORF Transcript_14216/g.49434 Transcript_14216/m.49434 type:complete len:128 (-) Transcript_14216:193-576(-)